MLYCICMQTFGGTKIIKRPKQEETYMNILVANDDGIEARGIHELVDALKDSADIYVCAPESQRSASGHGITVAKPILAEEAEFEGAVYALKMSGTPADCVKLGMRILAKKGIKIDMVFSGINHGGNLGTDTLYSGTVSAAIEGNICGVPAVAISVDSHEPEHFELAKKLAAGALKNAAGKLSSSTVLNINVPNAPEHKVKGVKYASLGEREYRESFEPLKREDGKTEYRYTGIPVVYEGLPDTIDVVAMQEGYATITPLKRDLTDRELIDEVKGWGIEK